MFLPNKTANPGRGHRLNISSGKHFRKIVFTHDDELGDRLATESELEQMRSLVRRGMEAGAYGLSSGPFYVPGSYSDTRELVELAKVAGAYDGT